MRSTRIPHPRFTVRALFGSVTVLCVWIGYSFNLIRQRREVFAAIEAVDIDKDAKVTAPWLLFVFGERGHRTIAVPFNRASQIEHFSRLQVLFPEAEVCTMYVEPSPSFSRPWPWAGPEGEEPEAFWGQTLLPNVSQ